MIRTEIIFKLLKMTKKMEILDQIKGLFKKVNTMDKKEIIDLQEQIGIEFAITVINNADKAEEEFYDIIASIQDQTPEEVKKQELDTTIETLKDLITSGAFKSFLSLASK